jgi:hypothetical protein
MSASSDELLMPSDIEMATPEMVSTTRASVEIASTTRASAEDGEGESGVSSHQGELGAEDALARVTYIDYLKSPIITLLVGQADDQAILSAHQALLMTSPWFAEACAKFDDDLLVGESLRRCHGCLHIFLCMYGDRRGRSNAPYSS